VPKIPSFQYPMAFEDSKPTDPVHCPGDPVFVVRINKPPKRSMYFSIWRFILLRSYNDLFERFAFINLFEFL